MVCNILAGVGARQYSGQSDQALTIALACMILVGIELSSNLLCKDTNGGLVAMNDSIGVFSLVFPARLGC